MTTIHHDSTRAEAQQTFTAILTHPMITAPGEPILFGRVLRNRTRLTEWAAKLGYRLVVIGTIARLHRDPVGPQRTAAPPPWDPPARRDLVLVMLAAAACETTDGTTTVQVLSDEVRALSANARLTSYNPDRRTERQSFVRALRRLSALGILQRRTTDEGLLRQWEEDGTGVGAGFEINGDALLQFTDPHTVELALAQEKGEDSRTATRGQRMLRTLVEDTALLYAELHPVDAEYARAQRSWLASQAADMTGGRVEIRAEGLLLILPEDWPSISDASPAFPAATAPSWFALKILETAMKRNTPDEFGRVHLSDTEVDAISADIFNEHRRALTKALSESPGHLRAATERIVAGLGLVKPAGDGWMVLPVAARYRDPKVTWEPTALEEVS